MTELDWAAIIPAGDPAVDTSATLQKVQVLGPGRWWLRPGALARSELIVTNRDGREIGGAAFSVVSWVTPGDINWSRRAGTYWADSRQRVSGEHYPVAGWLLGVANVKSFPSFAGRDLRPVSRVAFQLNLSRGQWPSVYSVDTEAPTLDPASGPRCVVVTVDPDRADGIVTIWIDGREHHRSSGAADKQLRAVLQHDLTGSSLLVGDGRDSDMGPGVEPFNGELHALGIVQGRAITGEEVVQLTDLMHVELDDWATRINEVKKTGPAQLPETIRVLDRHEHRRTRAIDTYAFCADSDVQATLPQPAPRVGIQDFTVVAWIRRTAGADVYEGIADTRAHPDALQSGGWLMGVHERGPHFEFTTEDGSDSPAVIAESAKPLDDGRWHCIAARVDRRGTIDILVDGALVHEDSFDVTEIGRADLSGGELRIGRSRRSNSSFGGEIATILVAHDLVGVAELERLANATLRTPADFPDVARIAESILAAPLVNALPSGSDS